MISSSRSFMTQCLIVLVLSYAIFFQFTLALLVSNRNIIIPPIGILGRQQQQQQQLCNKQKIASYPKKKCFILQSSPWDFDDDDDFDYEYDDDNYNDKKKKEEKQQPSHFFSQKSLQDPSFDGDDMFFELCQKGAGISQPSKVQSLAWPILYKGKHTIIADQTGSGKTLAYLIPLLRRMYAKKNHREKNQTSKQKGTPSILILAPTAELADQVRAVCFKLSSAVNFRTMVVTASGKFSTNIRDQIRMIQREHVDVLISTPGRLSTILRTRKSGLDLSHLQSLVLDEVDILFLDETFGDQLRVVGQAASSSDSDSSTQFVFVTATLPDSVVTTIRKEFPNVAKIRGPGLHRVAPTVKERLVDVSVPSNQNRNAKLGFQIKAEELLKALRQNRCQRTLIFCNTVETCRNVENLLNRKYSNNNNANNNNAWDVRSYHNAMKPEARNKNLQIFSHGYHHNINKSGGKNNKNDNVSYILVCTDRAARGVDFEASPVDHVLLFDFPKDPAEYVRRVGRTARAGRTGASTVFAYGWQLPIARSVMGKKLDDNFATSAFEKDYYLMDDGDNDDDDNDPYMGSVQQRRRMKQQKQQQQQEPWNKKHRKNNSNDSGAMRKNIEGGKLWTEKN